MLLDSVREEIRRTGCGLVPPPPDFDQFCARRLELGAGLLSGRLPGVLPIPPHDWTRLSRIAGQGAMVGGELHHQLGSGRDRARVVEACAWLNLLVACFDGVLDERPASVPELLARITHRHLDEALNLGRAVSAQPVFNHDLRNDPAPGFVAFVAEEAFRLCRELASSGAPRSDWETFAAGVRDAYEAEMATPELRIDNTAVGDDALVVLSRKSVLSVVMLGHAVLLCPERRTSVDPKAVCGLMARLGALIAEIDDVVDAADDLDAGRWSGFLLGTCRFTGEEIRRMGAAGSMALILERGVPRQVATRIARTLEEIAELGTGVLVDPDRFLGECRHWLAGWFTGADSAQAPALPPQL